MSKWIHRIWLFNDAVLISIDGGGWFWVGVCLVEGILPDGRAISGRCNIIVWCAWAISLIVSASLTCTVRIVWCGLFLAFSTKYMFSIFIL